MLLSAVISVKDLSVRTLLSLGIRKEIIESLERDGITELRPFQKEAIIAGLGGESLIIVAPTGSGKTLIAEVLAVNEILTSNSKVLYLTPYKALAEEIANTFRRRYPIRVGVATGDYRDQPIRTLGFYDLIVLTYEKTDHIFRENPKWLRSVKIAVVDEIHMLGDPSRGPLLDIVLTYFRENDIRVIGLSATIANPEDIGAWLNAKVIKSDYRPVKLLECVYLAPQSKLIIYDPRPQDVEVYLVRDREERIFKDTDTLTGTLDDFLAKDENTDLHILRSIIGEEFKIIEATRGHGRIVERRFLRDKLCKRLRTMFNDMLNGGDFFIKRVYTPDGATKSKSFMTAILDLLNDTFVEMQKYDQKWQVLIFRSSRRLSQRTAERIANFMREKRLYELFPDRNMVAEVLQKEISEPTALTKELIELSKFAVAFHHAGLSRKERQIIENAFREGKIGVLVATPTLAAGVNLPARRVIIEHKYYEPEFGGQVELSTAEYKQRGGRAGRPGYDRVGEVILIAKTQKDLIRFIEKYILATPESIRPLSGHVPPIVYSQILALISTRKKMKKSQLFDFFAKTFFAYYSKAHQDTYGIRVLEENIEDGLRFLQEANLIKRKRVKRRIVYIATELGERLSRLYLKPTSAKPILDMLYHWKKASIGHEWNIKRRIEAIYAAVCSPETWSTIRKLLGKFDELIDYITNHDTVVIELSDKIPTHLLDLELSDRRYLATDEEELLAILGGVCILEDWIKGVPIGRILEGFLPNFGPGDLSELVRVSDWLIYCMSELAIVLDIPFGIVDRLKTLSRMIRYGVPENLLELVENVEGIGRTRALALKRAGFDSLEKIAKASLSALTRVEGIGNVLAERLKNYARRKLSLDL